LNLTMSKQQLQKNDKTPVLSVTGSSCACAIMIGALVLAGCAQPQRSAMTGRACVPNIGKAETMALAEDVLDQMHFMIQKADVAGGVMRTRPLSGAQFFEFWRRDNVGFDNGLMANLQTIRRTVELNISPQAGELCIACKVRVQRLSLPERPITSSGRVYEMFSRSSPSLLRLSLTPQQKKEMAWIDLRNDTLLANRILRRIQARVTQRAGIERQSPGSKT
jgi:hypothetical protein